MNNIIIPITESFKELLVKNGYAIYEQGFYNGVLIFKAEREFKNDHISFYFYIDPALDEVKYTTIKKIPVELPKNSEK